MASLWLSFSSRIAHFFFLLIWFWRIWPLFFRLQCRKYEGSFSASACPRSCNCHGLPRVGSWSRQSGRPSTDSGPSNLLFFFLNSSGIEAHILTCSWLCVDSPCSLRGLTVFRGLIAAAWYQDPMQWSNAKEKSQFSLRNYPQLESISCTSISFDSLPTLLRMTSFYVCLSILTLSLSLSFSLSLSLSLSSPTASQVSIIWHSLKMYKMTAIGRMTAIEYRPATGWNIYVSKYPPQFQGQCGRWKRGDWQSAAKEPNSCLLKSLRLG